MNRLWVWLFLISFTSLAQKAEEEYLSSSDSLAIFQLLDSLINLEEAPATSQFALRVGYNSNINATNNALKFDEFGITTRAAFYHKSGAFIDVSGYWSNQYSNAYYLTTPSIGYMNYDLKHWAFLLEYGLNFYNVEERTDFITNSGTNYLSQDFKHFATGGIFYQWKVLNIKVDYTLLMGDRTAHRFNPAVYVNLTKNNWLGFARVTVSPTFSILFGIEKVEYLKMLYSTRLEALFRIRRNLPLFAIDEYDWSGVMNYSIRLPINFMKDNWGFSISYVYNIPTKIPEQVAVSEPNGSLFLSAVRYLEIKPRKKK